MRNFFLKEIDKRLTTLFMQRRFDLIRLFSNKKFKVILLYIIMRSYYLSLESTECDDCFSPTKEELYQILYKDTSRLSLSSFLDTMVSTGVILKKPHQKDKRKFFFVPSLILIKEFESLHLQGDDYIKDNYSLNLSLQNLANA